LERRWGVFFPRGGTGALVRALVSLFEQLGGRVRLRTAVRHIELLRRKRGSTHRVTSAHGAEDFDLVVSNADLHHTYSALLRGQRAAAQSARRIARLDWSMSLFVLYFGTDRLYRDRLAHHTVLFGPRYRELLHEIFRGGKLPDDFSLYLHAPTVTDASL